MHYRLSVPVLLPLLVHCPAQTDVRVFWSVTLVAHLASSILVKFARLNLALGWWTHPLLLCLCHSWFWCSLSFGCFLCRRCYHHSYGPLSGVSCPNLYFWSSDCRDCWIQSCVGSHLSLHSDWRECQLSALLAKATSSYAAGVKLSHSYLTSSLLAILSPQSAELESSQVSSESNLGNSGPIIESELVAKEAVFTKCSSSFQPKPGRLEYI